MIPCTLQWLNYSPVSEAKLLEVSNLPQETLSPTHRPYFRAKCPPKVKMRSYSNLPTEILFDVLSRLPAKSVGLSRCVSKPWRALLSRPDFIRTHLRRSTNHQHESLAILDSQNSLFCVPLRDAYQVFDEITLLSTQLIFANHPESWSWVHASCDGLLLVSDGQGRGFVLNPVTRMIREVPHSPFRLEPSENVYITWGFGYDGVSDDYKLVTISFYGLFELDDDEETCTDMFVNVFSLKTGSWKKAGCSPYDHSFDHSLDHSVGNKSESGVLVEGHIHWLAISPTDYVIVIVGFDLGDEKFCEVPLPPCSNIDGDHILFFHLAVLGGCLCMFNDSDKYVWMMKEYGVQESWTEFEINDPESGEIRLLCMLNQEQVVMSKDNEKLMMYNVKHGSLKDITVHGISEDFQAISTFVESLVSPHAWS